MILLQILSLVLWLIIVPFLTGLFFIRILPERKQTVPVTFIVGYLLSLSIFEIVAIPCMINVEYGAFNVAARVYMVAELCLCAFSVIFSIIYIRKKSVETLPVSEYAAVNERSIMDFWFVLLPGERHADSDELFNPRHNIYTYKRPYSAEAFFQWVLFAIVLAFQLYMVVTRVTFDGDDAYYVTESVLAQQAGVMNTILPYTGLSTSLDIRHALAVITMWEAFIAKMTGIHAAILIHTILPCFIISFVYLIYSRIAVILFRKKKDLIPAFMLIMAVMQMFGNTSIYTPETFLLTRTSQGKALVANVVIPLIIWIFLWIGEETRDDRAVRSGSEAGREKVVQFSPWLLLIMVNMLSGMCSSMGVFLGTGLIGALTILTAVGFRKPSYILGAAVSCIPNFVYVGIYLFVK